MAAASSRWRRPASSTRGRSIPTHRGWWRRCRGLTAAVASGWRRSRASRRIWPASPPAVPSARAAAPFSISAAPRGPNWFRSAIVIPRRALPMSDALPQNASSEPILRVEDLKVHFPVTKGIIFQRQVATVKAVDGVSFTIRRGETLGLVGESGSGKSTTGLAVLRMLTPTAGRIVFEGQDIAPHRGAELLAVRRRMQMVYQDHYGSVKPRVSIRSIVG